MRFVEIFNPLRIAEQLGPYYVPVVFGTFLFLFFLGSTCD